jgi:hypothetical protein
MGRTQNPMPGRTRSKKVVVQLDAETRAAVEQGIAQAERSEFVSDDVIVEADKRRGV